MSTPVSIIDIATASGYSKSTVSRALNGKSKPYRISQTATKKILAVTQQLGYQPNAMARDIALGKQVGPRQGATPPGDSRSPECAIPSRKIGLLLSATSSAETLALIPGLVPVLAAADYWGILLTLSAEPITAKQQLAELMQSGIAGILCCSTLYASVSATVATACPVVVLWQGAGKAIMKAVNGGELAIGSGGELPVTPPAPPAQETVPVVTEPTPPPPPPGRDDPCPCGSGKLYKKCHGKWGAGQTAGTIPPADVAPITNNPITNTPGAVAPDDPCPCGSGKKYKKCHGKWGAGQTAGTIPPADVAPITDNPITNTPGAVAPDAPCPCGSGKKYKKCHGKWGGGGA